MDTDIRLFTGIRDGATSSNSHELALEEMRRLGYTVLPNAIEAEDLPRVRDLMDQAYAEQIKDIGSEEDLNLIGDNGSVKHLLSYDDIFIDILSNKNLLDVCRELMGEYFILHSQNGVINSEDDVHPASYWHRDLAYQQFSSSKPVGISFLNFVDGSNEENGGVYVLPGSHLFDEFPSLEYAARNEILVNAPPGSAMIFDGMLYHRGSDNTSGALRRSISHVYVLPFIKQQISLPSILGDRFADDTDLARLLGYGAETANSAVEWRQDRIKVQKEKSKNKKDHRGSVGRVVSLKSKSD